MSSKKNLLIHVESSFGELDSFLPLLYYLNNTKKYHVITFFDNTFKINVKTENNILYSLVTNMSDEVVILRESNSFNFTIRVLQFLNRSFKFDFENIINFIKRAYISLKINRKFFFDIIILNSPCSIYPKYFYGKKIYLPHSQHIYPEMKSLKLHNNVIQNQSEIFCCLSNKNMIITKKLFKNYISHDTPIICIGYPKYTIQWYKFLNKFYQKNIKCDLTVFLAYNQYLDSITQKKYLQEIDIILNFIIKFKLKAIFKLHPRHQLLLDDSIFSQLVKSKRVIISNDHPFYLSKNSKFVISQHTSVILDALYTKKPVIELTHLSFKSSAYQKLKLVHVVKNKDQLNSIYLSLKKNNFKNNLERNYFNYIEEHKKYQTSFLKNFNNI